MSAGDAATRPRPTRLSPTRIVLLTGLIIAILALLAWRFPGRLPPELRVAAGFALFFFLPGLLFIFTFFPGRISGLETYPAAIALSMGVWAFPGLIAYFLGLHLEAVIGMELAVLAALALGLAVRSQLFIAAPREADEPVGPAHVALAGGIALAVAAAGAWTGAFRGLLIDWDYYNYISAVNKLLAWGRASTAHFAYADAPPDPIHSYNVWALQWALIGRIYGLSAVELYLRSAFLTMPAAVLGIYALGRRLLSAEAGLAALILLAVHQTVFGGLMFLGTTTLFPDDSQWLAVFPIGVALFLRQGEVKAPGLTLGVALAALGMAITHVLWGLCFYVTMLAYLLLRLAETGGGARRLAAAWKSGKAPALLGAAGWAAVPILAGAVTVAVMAVRGDYSGRTPLLGSDPGISAWIYALIFIVAPVLYVIHLTSSDRPRLSGRELLSAAWARSAVLVLLCLLVAVPYAYLRWRAIHATNWAQFGRNPYQAFLTSAIFILNPLQRTLIDANMTFFPLYLLSYACLPVLLSRPGRGKGAALTVAIMFLVPLVCLHPVLATLFARYFSLGYLRRFLRLLAVFSYFPPAYALYLLARWVLPRRPLARGLLTAAAAAAISAACIPFPADPPYFHDLLKKTLTITRDHPRDSLLQDDTAFRAIAAGRWFKPDDVLFSDLWTSFRLTAYLPQFVAVQAKPGVGVKDQDERMQLLVEFYDPQTTLERMRAILARFHAAGVIVNRSPIYVMGSIPCAYPEIIGKLKADPRHFELVHDQGDWAIFRVRPE
jgi:hypothetical protein